MTAPPHDFYLNTAVEKWYKQKNRSLENANEIHLIVIILSRASGNPEDYYIDFSEVHSTNDVFIR